jgi:hypothetical protein
MDQTLSLYLLETIPLMDPQAPDFPLVLLSLVESILKTRTLSFASSWTNSRARKWPR